jgi:FixJ family two-component response regulator
MRDFLTTAASIDCVVLDAVLPGEASISLALHLKESGIPVVIISGSPDAMKFAADNGLQLLRKPFRSHELCSSVNTALASGEFGQRSQDHS